MDKNFFILQVCEELSFYTQRIFLRNKEKKIGEVVTKSFYFYAKLERALLRKSTARDWTSMGQAMLPSCVNITNSMQVLVNVLLLRKY